MEELLPAADQSTASLAERSVSGPLASLSVIVPIGPGDESWRELIFDLQPLPAEAELLLVATSAEPQEFAKVVRESELTCCVQWLTTSAGRARQLNAGAAQATGKFLWLLHADTRVPQVAFNVLEEALRENHETLYFFDLEFRNDGPGGTRWNTRGVRFRSHYLGLPFGDQGFCLRRETLQCLGGFDQRASYGEDHLLVWAAKRSGIPLVQLDATLSTSARKYARSGWLRTTLLHLWRTVRQALPEWWKLYRG